jgi:hypothetical protein
MTMALPKRGRRKLLRIVLIGAISPQLSIRLIPALKTVVVP